jgi:hypothetical protein
VDGEPFRERNANSEAALAREKRSELRFREQVSEIGQAGGMGAKLGHTNGRTRFCACGSEQINLERRSTALLE